MNTESTADAVRRLERSIPVYDARELDYGTLVTLVDGREFYVDAPFEGDVAIAPAVRTYEGGLELLEDLDAELTEAGFDVRLAVCRRTCTAEPRVRDDVGGWAR